MFLMDTTIITAHYVKQDNDSKKRLSDAEIMAVIWYNICIYIN